MTREIPRTAKESERGAHAAVLAAIALLLVASESIEAQPAARPTIESLKITLSYSYENGNITLRLLAAQNVNAPVPPSLIDAPRAPGLHYELRNGDAVLYRRAIVSPLGLRKDVELSKEQRFRCSYTATKRTGILPLIVPYDRNATEIVFFYRPEVGEKERIAQERDERTFEQSFSVAIDDDTREKLPPPPPPDTLAPDAQVEVLQFCGQPESKLNLIILGDGYTKTQIAQFHEDAGAFWEHVKGTPPFNQTVDGKKLHQAFNVYRIDVPSQQDGADVLSGCGEDALERDTEFDAAFCSDGKTPRLLNVDATHVKYVVDAKLGPALLHQQILVIVNSDRYGGYGDSGVCVSSTGSPPAVARLAPAAAQAKQVGQTGAAAPPAATPYWVDTALHEFGHSMFVLADEYDYYSGCDVDGSDYDRYYSIPEPTPPNITRQDTVEGLKKEKPRWFDRLGPSGFSKFSNVGCKCDEPPIGAPEDVVGLFEGAAHYRCEIYRPQLRCKMRDQADPFCAVCSDAIVENLKQYLP